MTACYEIFSVSFCIILSDHIFTVQQVTAFCQICNAVLSYMLFNFHRVPGLLIKGEMPNSPG